MAETTADVRRDIELTRERMSDTITQLERKLNVVQVVREHPWPALAVAVGAGLALAGSKADVKAAAATARATGGASSKVGGLVDDVTSRLIAGVTGALSERVDAWVDELKAAIGAPGRGRERTLAQSAAARPLSGERGSALRESDGPYMGEESRAAHAREGSYRPLAR